jgi:hypothetical protein
VDDQRPGCADGIITDYARRLRAVMKALGMPLPSAYRIG